MDKHGKVWIGLIFSHLCCVHWRNHYRLKSHELQSTQYVTFYLLHTPDSQKIGRPMRLDFLKIAISADEPCLTFFPCLTATCRSQWKKKSGLFIAPESGREGDPDMVRIKANRSEWSSSTSRSSGANGFQILSSTPPASLKPHLDVPLG